MHTKCKVHLIPRTLKPKIKCRQASVGVLPGELGSSASESWMGLSPCFQFPFSCRALYPYLLHHWLDHSLLTFTFGIPTNANVWLPSLGYNLVLSLSISSPHCIRCQISFRLTFFTSFICSVAWLLTAFNASGHRKYSFSLNESDFPFL